jgi:hypothetical protein
MDLHSDRIRVEDSPEAMARLFEERGWSDGLPIVPPTADRVEAMLAGTDLDPRHEVGVMPPRWGVATLEKLAVNAVMAGCRPDDLPVIVAAVEALLAEPFNLYGVQATTHPCAPLLIVNGPARERLGINSGPGCFGPGWRANATIGRAIRLILWNVGGGVPGQTDRATQGSPAKFSYCIAEHEEQSPWAPLHVERGLAPGESAVTAFAGEAPHNVNDHVSTTAEGILTTAADTMAVMGNNNYYLRGEVLLVLGPEHAETIARPGWSRADVQAFVFEHARKPRARLARGGMYGMRSWPRWVDALGDDEPIPLLDRPQDLLVAVAGGPGKHSCFVPSFGGTRAVTRPIRLPRA